MRLNCGPTRAAKLELTPESTPARRPRGAAFLAAVALAGLLTLAASPAVAEDAPSPTQPQPVLVLNDCSATLSLIDLVPGRGYDITVRDAAGSSIYEHSFVASDVVLDSFFTVPAGTHELRVSDSEDSGFTAIRDVIVGPCQTEQGSSTTEDELPAGPSISATPGTCDLLGATDVTVVASGLGDGAYPVGVVVGDAPVAGVADSALTAEEAEVVFADLPNGASYGVWLKDPEGSVVASASVELPICDLPTLDTPEDEADPSAASSGFDGTLAATGIPVAGIIVGAIGALQVGALIGGTALLRGRGRGEHRGIPRDALLP